MTHRTFLLFLELMFFTFQLIKTFEKADISLNILFIQLNFTLFYNRKF